MQISFNLKFKLKLSYDDSTALHGRFVFPRFSSFASGCCGAPGSLSVRMALRSKMQSVNYLSNVTVRSRPAEPMRRLHLHGQRLLETNLTARFVVPVVRIPSAFRRDLGEVASFSSEEQQEQASRNSHRSEQAGQPPVAFYVPCHPGLEQVGNFRALRYALQDYVVETYCQCWHCQQHHAVWWCKNDQTGRRIKSKFSSHAESPHSINFSL